MQTLMKIKWEPKPITHQWAYCSKKCPAMMLVGFEIGSCYIVYDYDFLDIPICADIGVKYEDQIYAISAIRQAENWRILDGYNSVMVVPRTVERVSA